MALEIRAIRGALGVLSAAIFDDSDSQFVDRSLRYDVCVDRRVDRALQGCCPRFRLGLLSAFLLPPTGLH